MGMCVQAQFFAPPENLTDVLQGNPFFHRIQDFLIAGFHAEFDHMATGFLHQGQHGFVDAVQPSVANPSQLPSSMDDLFADLFVSFSKHRKRFITKKDFPITLVQNDLQFAQNIFGGSDLDDVRIEPRHRAENAFSNAAARCDRDRVGVMFDHRVEVIVVRKQRAVRIGKTIQIPIDRSGIVDHDPSMISECNSLDRFPGFAAKRFFLQKLRDNIFRIAQDGNVDPLATQGFLRQKGRMGAEHHPDGWIAGTVLADLSKALCIFIYRHGGGGRDDHFGITPFFQQRSKPVPFGSAVDEDHVMTGLLQDRRNIEKRQGRHLHAADFLALTPAAEHLVSHHIDKTGTGRI